VATLRHPDKARRLEAVAALAASGAPTLKRQLLGPVEYEACLGEDLNGWVPQLPPGVELRAQGKDWLRFRIEEPEKTNPLLLQRLLDDRLPVVSFHEVPRSLEQAFLNAVGDLEQ
jgi:ABC-2 type transport system ATP-binding protein